MERANCAETGLGRYPARVGAEVALDGWTHVPAFEKAGRGSAPDRPADLSEPRGKIMPAAWFESMPDSRFRSYPAGSLLSLLSEYPPPGVGDCQSQHAERPAARLHDLGPGDGEPHESAFAGSFGPYALRFFRGAPSDTLSLDAC
jgi:hypothetical protein